MRSFLPNAFYEERAVAMHSPLFFVYPRTWSLAQRMRDCFYNQTADVFELSRTQFLFELDILDALEAHPLRSTKKEEASVFVLPLLAFVSRQTSKCALPTLHTHGERVARMLSELQSEADFASGPHLVTCTCVMQRPVYSPPLFDFLLNRNRSLVMLSQARRAPPISISYTNVIAPYHSPPSLWRSARTCRDERSGEGGGGSGSGGGGGGSSTDGSSGSGLRPAGRGPLGVFAGSLSTGRELASRVRERLWNLSLAAPTLFVVRRTERLASTSTCGADGSCVNGVLHGARHERVPAKPLAAQLMQRAAYCFVPEGDSPESSRLFDAIAALCPPVVITTHVEGLLVPRSPHWRAAVLLLSVDELLGSPAHAVAAWLEADRRRNGHQRCEALSRLRADLAPSKVLQRAVVWAAGRTTRRSVEGGVPAGEVYAEGDVLRPPWRVLPA